MKRLPATPLGHHHPPKKEFFSIYFGWSWPKWKLWKFCPSPSWGAQLFLYILGHMKLCQAKVRNLNSFLLKVLHWRTKFLKNLTLIHCMGQGPKCNFLLIWDDIRTLKVVYCINLYIKVQSWKANFDPFSGRGPRNQFFRQYDVRT